MMVRFHPSLLSRHYTESITLSSGPLFPSFERLKFEEVIGTIETLLALCLWRA